ncbi:MAG: hypothetical protein KAZ87_12635 [Spirochaetes bacterium]|nr:hypothetical protein [Spirochaetota bacterium]
MIPGYESDEEMSIITDVNHYQHNKEKANQGRNINGKTPYQAFIDIIIIDDGDLNSAAYFYFQRKVSGEYHHCTPITFFLLNIYMAFYIFSVLFVSQ